MTLSEIIGSLAKLSASIQPDEFIYDFLTVFGTPKATISPLKSGDLNLAQKDGCTLLKAKIYFEPLLPDLLKSFTPAEAIQSAQRTRQIMGNKPRFLIGFTTSTPALSSEERGKRSQRLLEFTRVGLIGSQELERWAWEVSPVVPSGRDERSTIHQSINPSQGGRLPSPHPTGSETMNVDPSPSLLCTSIRP